MLRAVVVGSSLLAACAAPRIGAGAVGVAPFVTTIAAWPLPHAAPPAAHVADSAAAWRELCAEPAVAALPLGREVVAFAVERAVVVVLPGPFAAPVAVTTASEEGVDVVTLTARPAPGGAGLVVLLRVAARPGQLAVVALLPDAHGELHERTLTVASGR